MTDREQRCELCKWWGSPSQSKEGRLNFRYATYQCHRRAPVLTEQRWPYTGWNEWCGEFEEVAP